MQASNFRIEWPGMSALGQKRTYGLIQANVRQWQDEAAQKHHYHWILAGESAACGGQCPRCPLSTQSEPAIMSRIYLKRSR